MSTSAVALAGIGVVDTRKTSNELQTARKLVDHTIKLLKQRMKNAIWEELNPNETGQQPLVSTKSLEEFLIEAGCIGMEHGIFKVVAISAFSEGVHIDFEVTNNARIKADRGKTKRVYCGMPFWIKKD